jgi:hypothetical protein
MIQGFKGFAPLKPLSKTTMAKPALSTLVKKASLEVCNSPVKARRRGEYIYITSRVGTPFEYQSSHKIDEYKDQDYKYAQALCDYHAMARSYYNT